MDSDDLPLMTAHKRRHQAVESDEQTNANEGDDKYDFSITPDNFTDDYIFANPSLAYNENVLQIASRYTYNEMEARFAANGHKLVTKNLYHRTYRALERVAGKNDITYAELRADFNAEKKRTGVEERTAAQRVGQMRVNKANRYGKRPRASRGMAGSDTTELDNEGGEDSGSDEDRRARLQQLNGLQSGIDALQAKKDKLEKAIKAECKIETDEEGEEGDDSDENDNELEETAEDRRIADEIFEFKSKMGVNNPVFRVGGYARPDEFVDVLRLAAAHRVNDIVEMAQEQNPEAGLNGTKMNNITHRSLGRVAKARGIRRTTLKASYMRAKSANGITKHRQAAVGKREISRAVANARIRDKGKARASGVPADRQIGGTSEVAKTIGGNTELMQQSSQRFIDPPTQVHDSQPARRVYSTEEYDAAQSLLALARGMVDEPVRGNATPMLVNATLEEYDLAQRLLHLSRGRSNVPGPSMATPMPANVTTEDHAAILMVVHLARAAATFNWKRD